MDWEQGGVSRGGEELQSQPSTAPPQFWPRILTALFPCHTCGHISGIAALNLPHSSFPPASQDYKTSPA